VDEGEISSTETQVSSQEVSIPKTLKERLNVVEMYLRTLRTHR
jgi:hypothetical protein